MLTTVKDTLPLGKQSNVVYLIPFSCSQVYIGVTRRRPETETGDETEGTPTCLQEGDDEKVAHCDEEAEREEQSSTTFDLQ